MSFTLPVFYSLAAFMSVSIVLITIAHALESSLKTVKAVVKKDRQS